MDIYKFMGGDTYKFVGGFDRTISDQRTVLGSE